MKIYRLYDLSTEARVSLNQSEHPLGLFDYDLSCDPIYTDYATAEEAMAHVTRRTACIDYIRYTLPLVRIESNVIMELDAKLDEDGDVYDYEDCGDVFRSALPDEIRIGSDTFRLNEQAGCYQIIDDDEE